MSLKYRIPLAMIAIMLVATMFVGSSYAYWKVTKSQTSANVIETGCFKLTFTEQTSSISLKNTYPMSDTKGLSTTPYTFTITNTCTIDANYVIYLNTLQPTKTKISDSLINYSLTKSTDSASVANALTSADVNTDVSNFSYSKTLLTSYTLATGTLAQNASAKYSLRLWIDDAATTAINGYGFEAAIASVAYASPA